MCELEEQLALLHKWLHQVCEALPKEDVEQADRLGTVLLHELNEGAGADMSNGVKLLALYHAMTCGVDHMEKHEVKPDEPITIQ